MTRRAFDWYPTPAGATRALMARVPLDGPILECCSGDGAIATVLAERFRVDTNDIDGRHLTRTHADATTRAYWRTLPEAPHWVVSNPPFSLAPQIVPLAHEFAVAGVAMLLRLSYLEPCENRSQWLSEYPPTRLIVLPRISFTGDGKTDSVCAAWFVWQTGAIEQSIEIVPKESR